MIIHTHLYNLRTNLPIAQDIYYTGLSGEGIIWCNSGASTNVLSVNANYPPSGTKTKPKEHVFGPDIRGRPGVVRAGVRVKNFGQALEILEETGMWARTSMTRTCGHP